MGAAVSEPAWKPGDLCVLGGRSTFKVGYVVGPSRSAGKTTVKSFSANKRRFSGAFAIDDALVLPLPVEDGIRGLRHARTIRLATLASAAERRDLRDDKTRRAAKQEAAQIEAAAAGKPIDPTLVAAAIASNSKQRR